MKMFVRKLLRTKNLNSILSESDNPLHGLKKVLGPFDLILMGIGVIIGAGIFATVGTAAAGDALRPGAGPALMLSFAITAVVCGLAALCYAELASLVPISGSAYTYSYATFGEMVAWIIGWDLMLEYGVGSVAVSISWSSYFLGFLRSFGITVPHWVIAHNIPAIFIVLILTAILVKGIKESARFNMGIVLIKLLVLGFFVGVGAFFIKPQNWVPFAPNGFAGIRAGAAIAFFSYIGFDCLSTAAEETKDPKRSLPIGILGSLAICTVIYITVTAVFTGIIPFPLLTSSLAHQKAEPLALAFQYINLNWAAGVVAIGSVAAQIAVLLVLLMGQARIFFSMSRDGLLPSFFSKVHSKFRTPYVTTIITGLLIAFCAGFTNIEEMVDLTNIGTLFAFVLVCIGVIILRVKEPKLHRGFRVPFSPITPILGAAACIFLMTGLPGITWIRFFVWLVIGLVIYSLYGIRHSHLHKK